MRRLFCCCGKKSIGIVDVVVDESRQTPSSHRSVPDIPAANINNQRIRWGNRLFGYPLNKKRVALAAEEPNQVKQPYVPYRQDPVEEFTIEEEKTNLQIEEDKVLPAVPQKEEENTVCTIRTVRNQQLHCLGFPNLGQSCYMNSCLQSLLTLVDFDRAISSQEQTWSLMPEAVLMRSFVNISQSYFSSDTFLKIELLTAFKTALSAMAPEFKDHLQKDAHEFLTTVLDQISSLSPKLQMIAASTNSVYRCPVETHMEFRIQNIRTCQSCSSTSIREEVHTNLSLDLRPGGGTVEDMLQDYLEETELEYRCECGGTTSSLRSAFVDLPKVLILHLKRFRFSEFYQIQKVHCPVVLLRDLVLSSNQGGGCYSLVSAISHLSPTAAYGHYISDGVDVDVGQMDPNDRWFTYDDAKATETTGASVSTQREKCAYILFYKRQD